MSIPVENSTKEMLTVEDEYETDTESNTTIRGVLKWSIAAGKIKDIHSSKFIKQAKQYMQVQRIRVEAAGAPPLHLCPAEFSSKDGHRLVFTMAENNGAPCLKHEFIPRDGGEIRNFREIWNSILDKAARTLRSLT